MDKTVFITGVTPGVGKACAEHSAARNRRLIICGRRGKRLQQLPEELDGAAVYATAFAGRIRQRGTGSLSGSGSAEIGYRIATVPAHMNVTSPEVMPPVCRNRWPFAIHRNKES